MSVKKNWKSDLLSGFLVFLIALPLCLGIAMASNYPAVSGVLTAIVGGVVVSFLGSARLTIKGPAAGLIVIALGCVTELGGGDPAVGYKRALAVGVIAALLQIVLALVRAGALGASMPASVVHGMLAAIGVIIIAKQAHVALGVTPESSGPLSLLAEIPHSLQVMNPEVAIIGLVALVILFVLPMVKIQWIRRIPGPMLALASAVPLGFLFDLEHEHFYKLFSHDYHLGPEFLIQLPGSLMGAIVFPDFSMITSAVSIKYVVMFALVGSIESLLSVSAVDAMDPEKQSSDLNRDLLATGIGNLIASAIGGLPMISEIVRSKANIDSGAKSHMSNFFHGTFLLLSVALIPGLLQHIPMAALAAMLVYTGFRLASPNEFKHVYQIGSEQLFLFVSTMLVTLATDLLLGVAVGLVLKLILHLKNGVPVRSLFRAVVKEQRDGPRLTLEVQDAAVFSNYLGLQKRLQAIAPDVREVTLDFSDCWVVDHTVLDKLEKLANEWEGRTLVLAGLDNHVASSDHKLAARRRPRTSAA